MLQLRLRIICWNYWSPLTTLLLGSKHKRRIAADASRATAMWNSAKAEAQRRHSRPLRERSAIDRWTSRDWAYSNDWGAVGSEAPAAATRSPFRGLSRPREPPTCRPGGRPTRSAAARRRSRPTTRRCGSWCRRAGRRGARRRRAVAPADARCAPAALADWRPSPPAGSARRSRRRHRRCSEMMRRSRLPLLAAAAAAEPTRRRCSTALVRSAVVGDWTPISSHARYFTPCTFRHDDCDDDVWHLTLTLV